MTRVSFARRLNHGVPTGTGRDAPTRRVVRVRYRVFGVAVRPIRIIGDPVLHAPTRPVETFDAELEALVADMLEPMAAAEGVGLAANQVGVPWRLFVFDCPDEERGERFRGVVVNPVLETSDRPETMPDPDDDEEGCSRCGPALPDRAGRLGPGHRRRRRGGAGGGGGARVPGPLPAARGRPPGRRDLHRPAGGRNRRAALKALKRNGWGVPGLPGTRPRWPPRRSDPGVPWLLQGCNQQEVRWTSSTPTRAR